MDQPLEIIDAFVDGERVDPAELKRALADDRGRDYLVDAWLLRESVQDEIAADTPLVLPMPPARRWSGLLMVAAVALFCLTSGYLAGYRMGGTNAPSSAPPPVNAATTPAPPERSFGAPAPTRVIQLQPGVDWKEGTGGD